MMVEGVEWTSTVPQFNIITNETPPKLGLDPINYGIKKKQITFS